MLRNFLLPFANFEHRWLYSRIIRSFVAKYRFGEFPFFTLFCVLLWFFVFSFPSLMEFADSFSQVLIVSFCLLFSLSLLGSRSFFGTWADVDSQAWPKDVLLPLAQDSVPASSSAALMLEDSGQSSSSTIAQTYHGFFQASHSQVSPGYEGMPVDGYCGKASMTAILDDLNMGLDPQQPRSLWDNASHDRLPTVLCKSSVAAATLPSGGGIDARALFCGHSTTPLGTQ